MIKKLVGNQTVNLFFVGALFAVIGFFAKEMVFTIKTDIAQAQTDIVRLDKTKIDREEYQKDTAKKYDEILSMLKKR